MLKVGNIFKLFNLFLNQVIVARCNKHCVFIILVSLYKWYAKNIFNPYMSFTDHFLQ